MSNVETKAKKPNLSVKSVLNWIHDHAMIIVIVLLALYVQTQRDAFLRPASLINIISLTAARLPMALGVAGCIILAGTDLTGGRVAGLTAFVAASCSSVRTLPIACWQAEPLPTSCWCCCSLCSSAHVLV